MTRSQKQRTSYPGWRDREQNDYAWDSNSFDYKDGELAFMKIKYHIGAQAQCLCRKFPTIRKNSALILTFSNDTPAWKRVDSLQFKLLVAGLISVTLTRCYPLAS
jgi:hypothetical protein